MPSTKTFNHIEIHGSKEIVTKLLDCLETYSVDAMFRYLANIPTCATTEERIYRWGTAGMAHPDHHGALENQLYMEVDSADAPPLGALKIGHRDHTGITLIECQYINRDKRELGYWRSDIGLTTFPFPDTYAQCQKIGDMFPMIVSILHPLCQDLHLAESRT